MDKLDQARAAIDRIDAQMAALYEERMKAVEDVADYKIAHDLPVLDASREAAVIEKNSRRIQDSRYREGYKKFITELMALSREYQHARMSQDVVAFQGTEGAFSHATCRKLFPEHKLESYPTFEQVAQAVLDKKARFGVIPFENTHAGCVGEVLDVLNQYPVSILEVSDEPIDQCLLAVPGATLKDIEQVYSKDQALAQSREFLNALGVQPVPYANTALAARYVAKCQDKSKAAIGARENAELYGLDVLVGSIQEDADNTTRFLVIGDAPKWEGDHFSLIISLRNETGALDQVIRTIARHGLNMDAIQSRPRKGFPFQYFFYIEMEGQTDPETIRSCVDDLRANCEEIRFLGAYTRRTKENEK